MYIVSPEFSFLDFDYSEYSDACDAEALNALPACDLGIKGQIEIFTDEDLPTTTPIYVGIADSDCNLIYDEDLEVTPICSHYRFLTTDLGSEVPDTDPYNLCYVTGEPVIIDFTTNPFDLVTSANLVFTIEFSPVGNQFQLYVEGKIYVFNWTNSIPSGYEYTQLGNIYFINLYLPIGVFTLSEKLVFRDFMTAVFDVNHSTTTTFNVGTDEITITGIPAGSYLSDNELFPFVSGITTVTASTNVQNWMYWNGSALCYYSSTSIPGEVSYTFEQALTSGQAYQFDFSVYSLYSDFEITITIDDGTNPPTTFVQIPTLGESIVSVTYEALLTTTHTITFELSDVSGHTSGFEVRNIEISDSLFFDVTTNTSGNVPVAEYSRQELIDLISELLGFDFDCEFTSCCEMPEIEFSVTLPDTSVYVYKLTSYWRKGFINFPALELETIAPECFTYAILDSNKNMIACSNLFEKVQDCCFVTKIEYSNNEDAFGFSYPTGVTNSVQFPFFLNSPKYPTTEKIYRQTNGIYKRLSADIEKEYDCETDYIQESYHDKLITALKHDTLIVTSNRLGFIAQMSQQGDYAPDWNSKIDFTSKAEFKLRKYFNGKNNNCGTNC